MQGLKAMICAALMALAGPVWAQSGIADAGSGAVSWLNQFRAHAGRAPLAVSPQLTRAAAVLAGDMAAKGFFGHTGSDGSRVITRARRQGYAACVIAENIAKGHTDLGATLASWSKSSGHRRNLLNSRAVHFGLVRAPGDIWVMVLARPGC